MNDQIDKVCGLGLQAQNAKSDADYFNRLIKESHGDEYRMEMWHDYWVTFYKEDLQALADSKMARAQKYIDEIKNALISEAGAEKNEAG